MFIKHREQIIQIKLIRKNFYTKVSDLNGFVKNDINYDTIEK